jgi:hypothetical protein
MKKFTTCLLIAFFALLFIATGALAQVTISGTVTLVNYDGEDLTFEPLESGTVYAFYYNGTEYSPAGSPAASGIFSYELNVVPGTKIGFLVTGPAGNPSVIATNCPFITVGNFDREDLHLEIYGKGLIDYIIANSNIANQETTAIILGRVDWVEFSPVIGISGRSINGLATGLENEYPDRLFWWVKESENPGLDLPQNLEVALSPGPGSNYQNSEVRAHPYLTTAPDPDLYQVSFARPIIGIEVSGTVESGADVDDEQPLASGCVSVRDKAEDLVRNSDEIGAADAGAFRLIAPWAEDIFLQVRGPAGGDFTWITYPFFSSGLNVEDVELQVLEKELIEGVLTTFDTTFDLDLGEDDYDSIGLIGGVVERIIYKQEGNDYEDAEGVSISITDTNNQAVDYKILYMNESGTFVEGTQTAGSGAFAILIDDPDVTFPLDVKFLATSIAEGFEYISVVEARVYALAEKDDGMITFAPIIVYYDIDEGDVPLDDGGGGGGGCFINTANSRR